MSIPSIVISRFSAILIKIPVEYFTELEQIFQKFIWKHKTSNSHSNLEKEEKVGGIMLPDIKLYYKAIEMKQNGTALKTIVVLFAIAKIWKQPNISQYLNK